MDQKQFRLFKVGEVIQVHACKADGEIYRSWNAAVESVSANSVVTIAPAGSHVTDFQRGNHHIEYDMRCYYWLDKFYNLIEVFDGSGTLIEIYVNLASPPELQHGEMRFKDHELDVSRFPPQAARLVDEDEFAEAVVQYQYSEDFQQKMYAVAKEALEIANRWDAGPAPAFGGDYA